MRLPCPQHLTPCPAVSGRLQHGPPAPCTRAVVARYTAERRNRRRDLVWDNLDETEERADSYQQGAQPEPPMQPYNPPQTHQAEPHRQTQGSTRPSAYQSQPASSGDDDGGWGEPYHSTEWGVSDSTSWSDSTWDAQTQPGASNEWPAGRSADPYQPASQPWQTHSQGSPEPEPPAWGASDYDAPRGRGRRAWSTYNGEDTAAWEFFADSGRQGSPNARAGSAGPDSGPGVGSPPPGMEQPPNTQPSDVTLLSRSEMEAVLPVTPTGRQAQYYQPRNLSERLVQVMGSVAATMLLSKSTALAAPALLYPLWSPWIRAALKNAELYSGQLKVVGLWRAQVLEVEILASNTYRPGSWGARANPMAANAVVRLLMGDPWEGGARVQLEFPYQPKSELLQPGEAVEALVLSKDNAFFAFKVIREVYAPGLGLWLAEYPFVDRTAFLDVSLQIERSRQPEGYGWAAPGEPVPYVVDVDLATAEETMANNNRGGGMGGTGYADGHTQPGAAGYDDGWGEGGVGGASASGGQQGAGQAAGSGAGFASAYSSQGAGFVQGVDGVQGPVQGEGLQSGSGYMDPQPQGGYGTAQAGWAGSWDDGYGGFDRRGEGLQGPGGDGVQQGQWQAAGPVEGAAEDWDSAWQQQQGQQQGGDVGAGWRVPQAAGSGR